ncbi:alpha/beta hydrolase [Microbispora sp. NEAU-D428]|uniref:alpha/beta fold hydrolase n=1 Tax=Microbispora sitophila TaxID=2771537 RepID=UPI001866AB1C|nr:alpha/beta hydrolase [Microbispora sitophila]MBE3014787.1 alpha/beta hydrolase [Microbispora sitophila]
MNASTCTELSVTSKDGTTIGYRRLGQGPGIVVVHGAMSSGYHHLQLAKALSGAFTVHLMDRRGRGLSGPYRDDHDIRCDVEDLGAVLTATGARGVFAVSAGALIALQAALTLPGIDQLALYEPLLFPDRATGTKVMARYDRELARGKVASALATAMKGAQLGPAFLNAMPHWLLTAMTKGMTSRTPAGDYPSFAELAAALHHEGHMISEMSDRPYAFSDVRASVLLIGGSNSSALLKNALTRVAQALPGARRIELPGLDHSSSWNKELRGCPEPVARVLAEFFRASAPDR